MSSDCMTRMHSWCNTLSISLVLALAGCASMPTPQLNTAPVASLHAAALESEKPATELRSGRFALQIDTQPPQSFLSSFDLSGGWPDGILTIYNPLGMQMARVEWTAQSARLVQGQQTREAASLDKLIFQLTGTTIPTAALIDWLSGKPTPAEGWNVDVSEWHSHRLVLERVMPAPRTVLRIAFES